MRKMKDTFRHSLRYLLVSYLITLFLFYISQGWNLAQSLVFGLSLQLIPMPFIFSVVHWSTVSSPWRVAKISSVVIVLIPIVVCSLVASTVYSDDPPVGDAQLGVVFASVGSIVLAVILILFVWAISYFNHCRLKKS